MTRNIPIAMLVSSVIVLAMSSCGGASNSGTVGPSMQEVQSFQAAAGDNQVGTAGSVLADPLTVQARTKSGQGVSGVSVQWTFSEGGGSSTPDGSISKSLTTVTDQQGETSVYWQLDTIAGDQTATATFASTNQTSASPTTQIKFHSHGKAGGAASIVVSPQADTLAVGDSTDFTATVLDRWKNVISGATVNWSSSDDSVVSVSSGGMAKANRSGAATVVATTSGASTTSGSTGTSGSSTVSGRASVSVASSTTSTTNPPGTVTDLKVSSVTDSSVTLTWTQVGDGTGNPAKYALRYATPTISWGSASATEVSVNGTSIGAEEGYTFKRLQAGTSYQFQLVSYRGTLSVDAVFGQLSNIVSGSTAGNGALQTPTVTVTPASLSFTSIGATAQLSAVAKDSTGNTVTNPGFTWKSLATSIATVSTTGLVTAKAVGTTAIIVTAACCGSATAPVTVSSAPPPSVEPFPSDTNAVNVISETFESYTSTSDFLRNGPWTIEQNPGGNSINIDTNQHYQGSKSLRMTLPAGASQVISPHLWRSLTGFSATYSVSNFQFYIKAGGNWTNGKGVILHNANEGQARPCGGSYYRYQIGMNAHPEDSWHKTYSYPRLAPKGEDDSTQGAGGCAGPINYTDVQTTNPYPGFVWQGRPDSYTPAPLVSEDPDIARAPWSGLDDGNWHRITISIKQNPGGYLKLWIDGYIVYDSEGNFGYASRPTTFNWEWFAANGRPKTVDIWVDNNTFWQSK